jgi:dTDP-4-dehydrorhamnose reductase
MRIYLTGATGFVGSNLAHAFAHEHGAEVVAPGHEHVDLTDELVVRRSVLGVELPDLGTMLERLRAEVEASWSVA